MAHQSEKKCSFGQRVWALPLVKSAADVASSMYSRAKDYNAVSKTTFDKAEKTVSFFASRTKPILAKVEAPLNVADGLACAALTKLEEKAPVITMTPEDINAKARKILGDAVKPVFDRYNNAVAYGTETVTSTKNYGITKAKEVLDTPIGKKVQASLDDIITWADQHVDNRLPADGSEGDVKQVTGNVIEKVVALSAKISRRMRKLADDRITYLKSRFNEALVKTNLANYVENVKKRVDSTKALVAAKAAQIKELSSPANLRERYNKTAVYAKDSYYKLKAYKDQSPENLYNAVGAAKSYTSRLYTPVAEAKTWQEAVTAVKASTAVVFEDLKSLARNSLKRLQPTAVTTDQSTATRENAH